MRSAALVLLAACAVAASAPRAAAQTPGSSAESPRLVRCGPRSKAACLSMDLAVAPAQAHGLARAGDPEGSWTAVAGPVKSEALRGDVVGESRPPLRLLVLVDVSGSMRGAGMDAARPALRSFLAELPAGSVRVAVVPFSASRVAARIGDARFVPAPQAAAQVDALPPPDGDTGLYSAIDLGLARLAGERRGAPAPGWDALLVLTDGRNDVRDHRNDRGLLDGAAGRDTATEAIRHSPAYVFTIGLGGAVDTAELRALGRVRGDGYVVQEDAVALRRALTEVRGWLLNARHLLLPLDGAGEVRLASGPAVMEARPGTGAAAIRVAAWVPPLFALPAFQEAPPSAAGLVAARPEPWQLRRAAVLAFFAGVFLVLWTAVPPLLAGPVTAAAAPATPGGLVVPLVDASPGAGARPRIRLRGVDAPASPDAAADPGAGGLRRDLHEAPPRRPSDTTAAVSRPLARRP